MNSRTPRPYRLKKSKRVNGKPTWRILIDNAIEDNLGNEKVLNKGCIATKIEAELRRKFPNLGITRNGETVSVASKKRALYGILDSVVDSAILQSLAIAGVRLNKTQDHKSERRFKATVQQVAHRVTVKPEYLEPDSTEIDAHTIASRVSSTAHGWFAVDPLALANELNEGMTIAAYPAI